MLFAAAINDVATVIRGNPVTFQLICLVGGADAPVNYVPPEGSVIRASVRSSNAKVLLSDEDISVVNQYGYMQINFTKEQTALMPLGRGSLVVTCEKDDYRHTFETALPFMLIDPPFVVP